MWWVGEFGFLGVGVVRDVVCKDADVNDPTIVKLSPRTSCRHA